MLMALLNNGNPENRMLRFSVDLPEEHAKRLKHFAIDQNTTAVNIIREALDAYLVRIGAIEGSTSAQ
jgi:hypothetical protein